MLRGREADAEVTVFGGGREARTARAGRIWSPCCIVKDVTERVSLLSEVAGVVGLKEVRNGRGCLTGEDGAGTFWRLRVMLEVS